MRTRVWLSIWIQRASSPGSLYHTPMQPYRASKAPRVVTLLHDLLPRRIRLCRARFVHREEVHTILPFRLYAAFVDVLARLDGVDGASARMSIVLGMGDW